MMKYYALSDREMWLTQDGGELREKEWKLLCEKYPEAECFEEKQYGLHVLDVAGQVSEEYKQETMRQYFAEHNEQDTFYVSRAKALLSWRKQTRYCSVCGGRLSDHPTMTARQCDSCGKIVFPRIEPCVIVLVSRGEQVLLARHAQRNQSVYACLAGFIEAGETPEQTVAREILEETGIRVKNIRYRGAQSWPFPSQLMLAYTAEYESGEICVQEEELLDARWFDRSNLPNTPPPGSVAWRLIHGTI